MVGFAKGSLKRLKPRPVSTKTIELEEYIAVFKIEKTADN
jgi:hypothetical protein